MNNILASAIVKLLTCYNRFKLISLFSVFFSFLFNLPVPEFHFFSLSLSTFPFLNLSLSLSLSFILTLSYSLFCMSFTLSLFQVFSFPPSLFLISLSVCCAFHFSVSLSSIANFVSDQDDPDPIYLSTGSKNRIPKGD